MKTKRKAKSLSPNKKRKYLEPKQRRRSAEPPPPKVNDNTAKPRITEAYQAAMDRRKHQREQRWEGYDTQDEEDNEDTYMPTVVRKTDNGGYLHTKRSRARIAKANRGNIPWNKGRVRSEADKAKISAGVRARNRGILLAKLEKVGLTEDQWNTKRKEIKYLRERLRRAKKKIREDAEKMKKMKMKEDQVSSNGAIAELQLQLDAVLAERDRVNQMEAEPIKILPNDENDKDAKPSTKTIKEEPESEVATLEDITEVYQKPLSEVEETTSIDEEKEEVKKDVVVKDDQKKKRAATKKSDKKKDTSAKPSSDQKKRVQKKYRQHVPRSKMPSGLRNLPGAAFQMKWTPHSFDATPQECLSGGPGGYICCSECSHEYSEYVTQTAEDIESQRTSFIAQEVEELLGYIESNRITLMGQAAIAKRTTPPIPAPELKSKYQSWNRGNIYGSEFPNMDDWQLTTPLEISAAMASTKANMMI